MNTLIKKTDKTNLSGLIIDKKKILKSVKGTASSIIDFNKIKENNK